MLDRQHLYPQGMLSIIDTKIDDGLPLTGSALVLNGVGGGGTRLHHA